ncbi:phage shock protein C (PspC) family protein [Pedobacter rhizosphaerae]|uniref:Phage shock protein C (PspC) family protein n=2 Tax=Pedobacter rhizosphaerae TaxID=390241 RepID=A0A1H9NR42_9SPHI|nr:phage shock protein C (PspC) family protein [Pedobacter rhizosphaerae]
MNNVMEKKLFRNEHDKMIAGVASGLADYMQVEVTIVRLLFALSAIFMAGGGLVAYIVMWIIVPVNNDPAARFSKFNDYFNKNNPNTPPFGSGGVNWTQPVNEGAEKKPFETQADFSKFNKPNDTGRIIGGLVLLVVGCFFLTRELGLIPYWISFRNLWPIIFIALGISIIAKSKRKNEWKEWQSQQAAATEAPKTATFSDTIVEEKPIANDDNNTTPHNPQV